MDILITVVVVGVAIWLIVRKYDAKVVMLLSGIVLLLAAVCLKKPLTEDTNDVFQWFNLFSVILNVIVKQLAGPSLMIMLLFGYTAYMSHIKATHVTVNLLSAPIKNQMNPTYVVLLVFIIGNLMCLIIPSASSLAILLMATLYPVFVHRGASPLSVAAVIATSAAIMPTPLAPDSILAANVLKMPVIHYVYYEHALISIPVLVLMGITHVIWQRHCDNVEGQATTLMIKAKSEETVKQPIWYGALPLLPLILMMVLIFCFKTTVSVTVLTLVSFGISVISDSISLQSPSEGLKNARAFFKGMVRGFTTVVAQIIAALIFVEGLKKLHIIDLLIETISELEVSGLWLVLSLCLLSFGVGMMSGSGLAMFYACIDIIPEFAQQANVSPLLLIIPLQLTSNLVKCVSFISPNLLIIVEMMGCETSQLMRRTRVPVGVAIVAAIIFSLARY